MSAETIKMVINNSDEFTTPDPDIYILRQGRRKPPAFPLELFGSELSNWMSNAAHNAGAPVDYVGGALISVSAALIGNSRLVSPWEGWSEPAALWMGLVGDPSSGKSPGIDPIMKIVRTLEQDMAIGFQEKQQEWETKRETAHCIYKEWQNIVKNQTKKGGEVPTMPLEAIEPERITRPRILVNDTSSEELGILLSSHNKGLLFYRDELSGWFGGFDRYNGKGADRAFWIEAYGGRSYVIDRVKHPVPIRVPYLLVNVMGGIQPDRLVELLCGADDGLTERFLWVWPDPIPPFRPTGPVDHTFVLKVMCKLNQLLLYVSDDENYSPKVVPLSEDAAQIFQEWREEHFKGLQNINGMLGSYYGKSPGHLLRLALVIEFLWWAISIEEQEPINISKKAIAAAAHLVDYYFKPMAERVFGDASIPEEERLANTLARYIIKTKPIIINLRSIRREAGLPGLRKAEKVAMVVDRLVEAHWLFPSAESTGKGRPREDYTINPRLWEVLK